MINAYRFPYLFIITNILWLAACPVSQRTSSTWSGEVVGVSDGDTITVLREKQPIKIRLQAVDCPEKNQPFGTKAKLFTAGMVFGKRVSVKPVTQDRYGRTVAWIYLGNKSLNEELLRSGMAWHYSQYDHSIQLERLVQGAQKAKIGLWSEANPIPPWEWRHGRQIHKQKARQHPASRAKTSSSLNGPLHGNTKSKIFHLPSCKSYNCKSCTAVFNSTQEALQAGYHPCTRCQPKNR